MMLKKIFKAQVQAQATNLIQVGLTTGVTFLKDEILRRSFITVEIPQGDMSYHWIDRWLGNNTNMKQARHVQLSTFQDPINYDEWVEPVERQLKSTSHLTPAGSSVFLRYDGHPMWVTRRRETNGNYTREWLEIKMLAASQEPFRKLMAEARDEVLKTINPGLTVSVDRGGDWDVVSRQPLRDPSTVILPEGQFEALEEDLTNFLKGRDWYHSLGIPFRRGYLLYGPPGGGKTTVITALATRFRLPLYILNLSNPMLDDSGLTTLLSSIPEGGLLLMEDVDALFSNSKTQISFSGLLNALDGVSAATGRLVFMTTNHIEALNPALIRPGRIDYRMRFDHATDDQIGRLFSRFFPEATNEQRERFIEALSREPRSMASVQNHLLMHRNDIEGAIRSGDGMDSSVRDADRDLHHSRSDREGVGEEQGNAKDSLSPGQRLQRARPVGYRRTRARLRY